MANVSIDGLVIRNKYTANQLADMWGYKDHHAIVKGIVTPKDSNIVILFVTKKKQSGATPYIDELKGNILYMQGQEKHGTDKRLFSNLNANQDEIYLFYRDMHHMPFMYYGRTFLIEATKHTDEPSEFQFLIENLGETEDDMSLMDMVLNVTGDTGQDFTITVEGARKIVQHIRYERNPKNRKNAIRIQGHICKICGFDFDYVYGQDLADNYIEVHHIKQLAEGEQEIDPSKDLIPICANCHRMLHRRKHDNIEVEELKRRIGHYQRHIQKME